MFQRYLLAGYRLIVIQIILLSIVAGIFVLMRDWRGLISVLLGGSAWIIPNLYFIRKLFKPKTNRSTEDLAKDLFFGEKIKLLLSAVLIIIIIWFFTVKIVAFFIGYMVTIGAIFLIPLWYKK